MFFHRILIHFFRLHVIIKSTLEYFTRTNVENGIKTVCGRPLGKRINYRVLALGPKTAQLKQRREDFSHVHYNTIRITYYYIMFI